MSKNKPYGVKISKAYEQGKQDALAYKKLNPQPSRWIRFLGVVSNSNLTRKYYDSYRIGYFEVLDERKLEQKKQVVKNQTPQKPKTPDIELLDIDRNIKQLERRRKLILAIERQKQISKER